jgi:ABC-type branched-subunit amino acid transport system ATPase component
VSQEVMRAARPVRAPVLSAIAARELCIASTPSVARPQSFSFDVDIGDVLVVEGPAQSGKTALLLTIAGRMKPQSGRLTVLGYSLPVQAGAVRAVTGLGVVQGVNDLDPSLTVAQHIAERVIFLQPWWRPRVSQETVDAYLGRANSVLEKLGDPAQQSRPPTLVGDRLVGDLSPLDQCVLGATLALIGVPQLLVIDDIDALRERENRVRAWSALVALVGAFDSLTVVVSCEDATDLGDLFTRNADSPTQPSTPALPFGSTEPFDRSRVKIVRMNRVGPAG